MTPARFLILLFFAPLLALGQKEKDDILWNSSRPLTWADFKGKPEKRFAAASTHYDLLKKIEGGSAKNATVKIEAVFFSSKSWKKEEWASESILAHEQKHFDVVELFARRLRKMLAQERFTSMEDLATKLDDLYAIADRELDVYQDIYDDETDSSMNGEKQREWNRKIKSELDGMQNFAQTTVIITFVKK